MTEDDSAPAPLPYKEPLQFPLEQRSFINEYLPGTKEPFDGLPYVTLTYATSLDAMLSVSPGVQTALSSKATKAMTHYLRAFHRGILIGVGTAEADDPTLDCRLEEVVQDSNESLQKQIDGKSIGHPVPIILDLNGRWNVSVHSNIIRAARRLGFGPIVITTSQGQERYRDSRRHELILGVKGRFLVYDKSTSLGDGASVDWIQIFQKLRNLDVESVMIEGGGAVIRSILETKVYHSHVQSVILTIAPVWLGRGGVSTTPEKSTGKQQKAVLRLTDTRWLDIGGDGVLCGRISS